MGKKHNRTLALYSNLIFLYSSNLSFPILICTHFDFFFHQKRLVFDECDRMLELGYKRDVQSVLNAINDQSEKKRQTLLLSATLTQGIEEMSSISLKHPKFIDAASVESSNEEERIGQLKVLTTPDNLQQTFAIIPAKLRLGTVHILRIAQNLI